MIARRAFFKRFGAVLAIVALAPELCFRQKLCFAELEQPIGDFWLSQDCISRVQSEAYLDWRNSLVVVVDPEAELTIQMFKDELA